MSVILIYRYATQSLSSTKTYVKEFKSRLDCTNWLLTYPSAIVISVETKETSK